MPNDDAAADGEESGRERQDGLAIIGVGIALLLVLEVEKRIRFRSEAS